VVKVWCLSLGAMAKSLFVPEIARVTSPGYLQH